ncbi:MAG: Fe-S cluster assembly protein SufD [Alphaproteobacteria bacterium]|nr:Fe-S cluster assembly protein SufD [Alphaproteobacteria bacterium]
MNALSPQNLPTPKDETWKYTNLPKALPADLVATPDVDEQEIVIHKNGGEVGGKTEDILFTGVAGTLHSPRLKLVLEEGAELTLVEYHTGEGAYWKNMTTSIIVGANAKLHHIRIQEDSDQGVNTNLVNIALAQDSVYDALTLNTGGKLTRHEIHACLNGPNAELSLNGINLLGGAQHGDTTILIEHKAPHCRSNQFYRSILDEKARGVFQGKVHVHQSAQKTDGYQLSNAILLSPEAEMDTKPELEIYADDVKCSHGATTGQLDEEPVFYLRSRGLSEKQARELLIQAFVDEVVDKIVDEEIRGSVREKTGQWLNKAL